ncbi:hypothetical protein [uncultured Corynebacterium sp.]|uniref:hypothetical protein n=1 Tax=uncultured Corynebacterium sp. TaxID=159447 RepID=UPI00260035F9|nr:hypothetical protein [uncultured Corynebacterium sp.]
MKNFRKAALAIATASSVALGSTAVASAHENLSPIYGSSAEANENVGKALNTGDKVHGANLWGNEQIDNQPGWWILTKTLTFGAIATAIAGLGIAIGNHLKNQGIII